LALVIVLACLTTAVGLMTACGEYFGELLRLPYRPVATAFVLVSWLVSNVGLTQLIQFSVPVLMGLYPLAIVLVARSLTSRLWRNPRRVIVPVMAVTLVFAIADGLTAAGLAGRVAHALATWPQDGLPWQLLHAAEQHVGGFFRRLPYAEVARARLVRAGLALAAAAAATRPRPPPQTRQQGRGGQRQQRISARKLPRLEARHSLYILFIALHHIRPVLLSRLVQGPARNHQDPPL